MLGVLWRFRHLAMTGQSGQCTLKEWILYYAVQKAERLGASTTYALSCMRIGRILGVARHFLAKTMSIPRSDGVAHQYFNL